MQKRGFLRNKLKMTLVSSLRPLKQMVLMVQKGCLQKCLSSSPSQSQRSRRVSRRKLQQHAVHFFSGIFETDLVICLLCLCCVSVVFPVQVKVEEVEMEMETPIDPPDRPKKVPLDVIKREEGGEQIKSGLHQASQGSSLENENMKRKETAAGRSEEWALWEENLTGEGNMEQSKDKSGDVENSQKLDEEEGSRGDDSAMEDISESNTEQDTTGEDTVVSN